MTWTIHGRTYRSVNEIRDRIAALDAAHPGQRFPAGVRDEWNSLNEAVGEAELEARSQRILELSQTPENREAGVTFHTPTAQPGDTRSAALRAIERHQPSLSPAAADRLNDVVRGDRIGMDAAYLAAVAEPAYNSAFGKLLQHGAMAPARFTPQEHEAVQTVNRAEETRAALAISTGPTGGFAVPFALDPTIMNTSGGVLNPVREVARVIELVDNNEWRGVSSAGVTSNYGPEGSEVNDDAPTLAQPTISAKRWTSFVPFSIEAGQDWATMQVELAALMSDAKDTLDAEKFATGTGVDEPGGILNIGGTGGLTTAQRVLTNAVATFAVGDVYLLKQSLPPRFQANGTYVTSPNTLDSIYRFVPAGSTTEAPLLNADRTAIIGRPVRELSTMVSTATTGSRIAIYADFRSAFAVVDRLGVQVELVNHLFGPNRRPTGQRGLLAIGRTGSGVITPTPRATSRWPKGGLPQEDTAYRSRDVHLRARRPNGRRASGPDSRLNRCAGARPREPVRGR